MVEGIWPIEIVNQAECRYQMDKEQEVEENPEPQKIRLIHLSRLLFNDRKRQE